MHSAAVAPAAWVAQTVLSAHPMEHAQPPSIPQGHNVFWGLHMLNEALSKTMHALYRTLQSQPSWAVPSTFSAVRLSQRRGLVLVLAQV